MATNEEEACLSPAGLDTLSVHENCDGGEIEQVVAVLNSQEPLENADSKYVDEDIEKVIELEAGEKKSNRDAKEGDGTMTDEDTITVHTMGKGEPKFGTKEEILITKRKAEIETPTGKNDEDYAKKDTPTINAEVVVGAASAETTGEGKSTNTCPKKAEMRELEELLVRNNREEDLEPTQTYSNDAALQKEYEASKRENANNTATIARATSRSSRQSSARGEASMPGAFAVENPMHESTIRQSLLESSAAMSASMSIMSNGTSNLVDSLASQSSATASVVLSPSSQLQQSHRDPEAGHQNIVQAVCVENQRVFDAEIVSSDDTDDSVQGGSKRNWNGVALSVGLLLTLVIALSTVLTRERPGSASNIDDEIYMRKRDALRAILAPLGGVEVFNKSSSEFSTYREGALDWLIRDELEKERKYGLEPSLDWKLRQRYVLVLLHLSTNGPDWKQKFYFKSALDECAWSAVKTQSNKEIMDEDNEFDIKGVICNRKGRAERIRIGWNNLIGTIPPEIAEFSESLIELNVAGGSLSGSIPPSFSTLTNLETFRVNDNCLSGPIPDLSSPNIEDIAVQNNPDLSGSLNAFCEDTSTKPFLDIRADCGGCTGNSEAKIECDCCVCCNPDDFQCCDNQGEREPFSSIVLDDLMPNDFVPAFEKQCVPDTSRQWIDQECPCVVNNSTRGDDESRFSAICTKDCTIEGATPSYNY